jgi:hypothetical protein
MQKINSLFQGKRHFFCRKLRLDQRLELHTYKACTKELHTNVSLE